MVDTKAYLPDRLPGFSDIRPGNQAVIVVGVALITSVIAGFAGLRAGITANDIIPVIGTVVFLLFLGISLLVFRAMFVAATKEDGTIRSAFTHPAFAVLFLLVVFAGAIYLGFLFRYI